VGGFSLSDSVEMRPGTFEKGMELTERLYNSCQFLRSSNRDRYAIEKEVHKATSELRDYILQLMKGSPCTSVMSKAFYIISGLVEGKMVQAGSFVEDSIMETIKTLCNSTQDKTTEVVAAALLALRSIASEVNDLKSVFTMHKLLYLERDVKAVYKELNMLDLSTFPTISGSGPEPALVIAGTIVNILDKQDFCGNFRER